MQSHAKSCKVMQSHAKSCKVMQSHAKSCKVDFASYNLRQFCTVKYPRAQSRAKSSKVEQSPTRKSMQKHAKSCKVMQSHAKSGTDFVCDIQSWCMTLQALHPRSCCSRGPFLFSLANLLQCMCKFECQKTNGVVLDNSRTTHNCFLFVPTS
jgi:hypothetical protein